jgi:hypothetical protein
MYLIIYIRCQVMKEDQRDHSYELEHLFKEIILYCIKLRVYMSLGFPLRP